MAVQTLSEALDNLYTTTWQHMKSTVADQIFDSTPFWFWLRDKGKFVTEQGGRFLTEPLQYAKNDSVKWIGKGGTVSLNDKEILTVAKFDWKYMVGNIVRFGVDDQQNRGKMQIINFMNAKFNNLQTALTDQLETKLFAGTGVGGGDNADALDGLQWLVPDDPTAAANTVGGIDPSTNTWWQSKTRTMTGESFATLGISRMRTMLNDCANNIGSDAVDIILTGQTPYENYEDNVLDYYRTTNNKLADAGFLNQTFKGIPMIWSPQCSNQRMYFLNTNFIKFVYDPAMFFDMTAWKEIPEQVNDRAAQIMTACTFLTSRRRSCGVIHTIDTE